MKQTRREFLAQSAIAGATFLTPAQELFAFSQKSSKPLDVLFLGGTGFIGPHMVRECIKRGHKVTLFNRGRRNTHLFPELELIKGNRDPKVDEGLSGLKGRNWDVVIDSSGYVPRHVNGSASLLKYSASHYVFISTVAVYSDFTPKMIDEDAPLIELEDKTVEDVGKYYGGLKVLCEEMVEKNFPGKTTILRPTYIVGPGDHTDRFIHYFDRPMQGGRMAVAGTPDDQISFVDVRDLAEFTVKSIEHINPGIYNMVNEPNQASFGELLKQTISLSKSDVELVWLNKDFLIKQPEIGDNLYTPFPMWLNPDKGGATISQTRSVAKGFSNRLFRETVIDTFNWWMSQTEERRKNKRMSITAELEKTLLDRWDKQNS